MIVLIEVSVVIDINIMCPLNVAMDTNTTSYITHIVATNNTIYYSYNNLSKYWVAKINHALKKRTKHKNSNMMISHDTMHGHSDIYIPIYKERTVSAVF